MSDRGTWMSFQNKEPRPVMMIEVNSENPYRRKANARAPFISLAQHRFGTARDRLGGEELFHPSAEPIRNEAY